MGRAGSIDADLTSEIGFSDFVIDGADADLSCCRADISGVDSVGDSFVCRVMIGSAVGFSSGGDKIDDVNFFPQLLQN